MDNLNDQNIFSEEEHKDSSPEIREEETVEQILEEFAPEQAPEEPRSAIGAEEQPDTFYRGIGSGRRESPFSDSPYVVNRQPQEEPYRPKVCDLEPEAEEPVRGKKTPTKKKKGLGRKLLACAAALALVAGSCGITAWLVNDRWEKRVDALEDRLYIQVQELEQQVEKLTPQYFGTSVSGTVAHSEGLTAGQVYAQNVHSVVLIESTVTATMYGQTATGISSGSGFILSEDGYVVTNYHVIEGATFVEVILYDGTAHAAEVVGYDSTNDIALLKMDAEGLDPVELGSSDDLIVGDQVVAIGNPLGELTSTLTVGYVSAKERTVSTDGTIINMIQTDAAINSGNSGGPLFNMKGQVVGITTAKYSGSSSSGASIEGIGFAIPMDDVLEELEELKEFGFIKSAYLGVMVQEMDAVTANVYGLPVGAYVVSVEEGYCAAKAGIQAKDIIVGVGDIPIESLADLTRALREYEPGDEAKITVYRGGQTRTFLVTLDERPVDAGSETPSMPEGEMPEGNYEEWYDYFAPFFGNGG